MKSNFTNLKDTRKVTYFFIDSNGNEYISNEKPIRDKILKIWRPRYMGVYGKYSSIVRIPNGSIEKIIGKKLYWSNDPIALVLINN